MEMQGRRQSVLSELVCPVCGDYLRAPILSCEMGHSVCELCHELLTKCPTCDAPFNDVHNVALEAAVARVVVPCRRCRRGFRLEELARHTCTLPDTVHCRCILGQVYGGCAWFGPACDLVRHCRAHHPQNLWTEMENLVRWRHAGLAVIGGIQNLYLLDLVEVTFVIVQKFDAHAGVLQWYASYQSDQELCKFAYEIRLPSEETHCPPHEALVYRAAIKNGPDVTTFLPEANEICVPLEDVAPFLSEEDGCLTYKVTVYKLGDVHLTTEDGDRDDDNNPEKTTASYSGCSRKLWRTALYTYNSVRNCFPSSNK